MRTSYIIRITIFITIGLGLSGLAAPYSNQNLYAAAFEPNRYDVNVPYRKIPPMSGTNLYNIPPEKLFSPSTSELFYEKAFEISQRSDITDSQAQQSIIFLDAAMELDSSAGLATADMLRIMSRPGPERHLQKLYETFIKYTDKNADMVIADSAAKYLLNQLDSRIQRETLLRRMIQDIGESNLSVRSELAAVLGLLYAEKADNKNAIMVMATAYNWNRYNQLAFEKLLELAPDQIGPALKIQYLRFKIRVNPFDPGTALSLAQFAQKIQLYELAIGSYQYFADLYQFLYPGQNVPEAIYIEWLKCCCNVPKGEQKCLQLTEQLRNQGSFNLQINVLSAMLAAKKGDNPAAQQIIKMAEQKAIQLAVEPADFQTLAWFYCFINKNSELAIDWANKAYAAEPNSAVSAGLLACAMADNNQPDAAQSLIDNFPNTQFADFARAKLQLLKNNKQSGIESLRSAIDKDPASIIAQQALSLLEEQKSDYIPIYDTNTIITSIQQVIGEQIVPQFINPERMLSFQLNIRGNRFAYGNDFIGTISITNNWYEPVVFSENGFCKGQISIDADVTGDIKRHFDKLVSITTRPSMPIEPGRSVVVPIHLCTGKLRELLISHPQASLNIRFTAYLDPIASPDGKVTSAIPGIMPAIIDLERPRTEINQDFLQNRFNSLSQGRQGPKIKAAQLFAGLLLENQDDAAFQTGYSFTTTQRMNSMLKSALVQGLNDSDWVVKTHSISSISDLPLDFQLTNAVSSGLQDQHWPTRMMAVWVLAQKGNYNFAKVLDHLAEYDENEFVQRMAIALGAKTPTPRQKFEKSFADLLKPDPNSESADLFALPAK